MSLTRYVPRNLRDDGMIEAKEIEHYRHLNLQYYVKAEDVRAVLEPFLHRLVISERTPQELKDWAYRLLQELVP